MTIPTFKQAERACINGTGTTLGKFIILYTPAGREEEKEFRAQLQAVLDESFIMIKVSKKLKAKK